MHQLATVHVALAREVHDAVGPSIARGSAKTRLMAGTSTHTAPNLKRRLFSSGTQSKHQAKFVAPRSRSQTSFIHCPPQGPGSKNVTRRRGRVTQCSSPRRKLSPGTSFGSPGTAVSSRKSQCAIVRCFTRSHTRQSTKNE